MNIGKAVTKLRFSQCWIRYGLAATRMYRTRHGRPNPTQLCKVVFQMRVISLPRGCEMSRTRQNRRGNDKSTLTADILGVRLTIQNVVVNRKIYSTLHCLKKEKYKIIYLGT